LGNFVLFQSGQVFVQIHNQVANNAGVLSAHFGVEGVNVFAVHSKIDHNIVRKGPPAETPIGSSPVEAVMEKAPRAKAPAKKAAPVLTEINQEELDKKIEEALSEDLTK
jgi:hypothetical protein